MSARKIGNKSVTDTQTPATILETNSPRSTATKCFAQIDGSETTTIATDALDPTMTDSKRPRRTNVRTPTTPTTTNRKKIDETSENISPTSSGCLEDEKVAKPSVDDTKIDDGKKTDSLVDIASPARPGRKRKIFDKTAIVTRKSAMDLAKSTKRVLRCDRRNSTGKAEIMEAEPPKKRGGAVKKLSSTPEQPVTAIKRKRENSVKLDEKDDFRKPDKVIKLEPTDIEEVQNQESDLRNLNTCKNGEEKGKESAEETYSKDDELVEVVTIKQETGEEIEERHAAKTATINEKVATGITKTEGSTNKDILVEEEPVQDDAVLPQIQEEKCEETKSRDDQTTNAKIVIIAKPEVTNDKPRRARTKRVLDIFTAPATRGAKKSEKTGSELNSTGKSKLGRKTKQAIAAAQDLKKDEVFATPASEKCAAPCEEECNLSGLATPLFVHIATKESSIEKEISINISPRSSENTASLSPELVSEGVNVISVKQYYKKPEFLENNLGIENDPKLGGIVQEVDKDKASCIEETTNIARLETENSTEKLPHRSPSCSGDSLKDSERLFLDDSTEDDVNKMENDQDIATTSQEIVEQIVLEGQTEAGEEAVNEVETLSNSSTVKNTNELAICDNSNILTAVDSEDTEEQSVGRSDIYLKDNEMEGGGNTSTDKHIAKIDDVMYESCENTFPEVRDEDCKNVRKMSLELMLRNAVLEGTVVKNNLKTDGLTEILNDDAIVESRKINSIKEDNEDLNNYEDIVHQEVLKTEDIDNLVKEQTDEGNEMEAHNKTLKNLTETPETLKEKEDHLKHLGLLTHKAAVEAKIEKQRRRKLLQSELTSNGKKNGKQYDSDETSETSNHTVDSESTRNNARETATGISNRNAQEYTGTLKTVIKINRQGSGSSNCDSKRKTTNCSSGSSVISGRQSLKMTFQKGRVRNTNNDKDNSQPAGTTDDTYYTIQNETEGTQDEETVTHGRKSHNRSHTTESTSAGVQENESKKDDKVIIVIPEKASSFSIHPGRLCQDQCYYCGGKFGLYDTPCHVAQLKSVERQQKILANEEKLTSDNCLCDACFRHIDRRANASMSSNTSKKRSITSAVSESIHNASGMHSDASGADEMSSSPPIARKEAKPKVICFLPNCENEAIRPLRRKFIRKTIKKLLPNFDMSSIGAMAQICAQHHDIVLQFLGCALCKRRLVKNSMYHINQDSEKLEQLLENQGIPVKLGNNTAVCKLCKYFTNLLLKPPDSTKVQKTQFVKNYRKRLLYCHNVPSDGTSDGEEQVDDKSENDDTGKPEKIHTVGRRGRKKKSLTQTSTTIEQSSEQVNKSGPKSPEAGMIPTSMTTSGQMMLDNDVLVDYDVPVPISDSPSPPPVQVPSKLQTILQSGISNKDDISIVLRSNPNISMRELFPGEEEMGLQINVPFGNSSSIRTPEGWTRVNTFLQYDDSTRRLWEDLQKPYGNQSSFLRHLILLEKYFRNGDLVLSQNATTNAVVYSETVHNRLRSYDSSNSTTFYANRANKRKGNNQNETPAEQISKQFVNLPVTITSKPKSNTAATRRSSCNLERLNSSSGNSSLKSNLLSNNRAVEILPIMPTNYGYSTDRSHCSSSMSRQQRLLEAATKLINSTQDSSINQATGGTNKKSVVSGAGVGLPPELISINRGQTNGMQYTKGRSSQAPMKQGSYKSGPPNVIILPDTLSPIERTQKNWRPTLVPVSSVNSQTFLSASGPLFQTADGRRLPALVQVQSGGRPYLISIHDYNRMCIMRREKLMRDQMIKGTKQDETNTSLKCESLQQQLQSKMQIPNKILEQNSLIPVGSNYRSQRSMGDHKNKKLAQQTLLKSATITTSTALIPIAPRPPGQLQMVPPTIASQQHAHVFGQNPAVPPNSQSLLPPISGMLTIAPPSKASSSTAWLWSSVADNATSVNGTTSKTTSAPSSTSSSSNSSSPSSLPQQQQAQGNQDTIILDNSLLSKIPKSLTVIPQQKSHRRSRTNSADNVTSA